ncbi:MAG: imelysin family protein [Algibacter sp.]|uniref:imelysin family protein n=1 Tax=Algibacter sp. TaxID=1872428 RepID=UPI0026384E8E|nr:imelysin family protein [Algibacter sp.]MDG1729415.1 imelysin family protein [Algibacter sp.]
MKHLFKLRNTLLLIAIATISFSCSDDDSDPVIPTSNYSQELTNIANNVIVETYKDLANKAADLHNEAIDIKTNITASNLDNARQAWRSAREPWEKSEGFLFGPVDSQGIDPAIDSWPVNIVDMDNLLSNTSGFPTITENIISNQTNEAKGFHLIEYLLWGIDGNKQVADFTSRELEYLVAACANLKTKTTELYDAWKSNGGNHVANFLNAGGTGSIYVSQKSALEDLVDGMITIADEVGNGKIETPFNGENGAGFDPTQEESRFSHNSKLDFANNVRSISNVYNGKFTIDGKGISDIVAESNTTLDETFKAQILEAVEAIEAIPGTFTDAISNNRTSVATAQSKVRIVQETLETLIKPLIVNL